MGKPYAKEGPSAEDKALDLFADMMIERIQSLSGKDGWKKPWFTEGALQWPKNLNGREYNGMNAMMLLLHCEKEGYKIPRFCTFDRIQQFNKTGKKDEEQKPRVSVLKGEHSFPVMLTTFTVVNKETKEHIKWEDYKLLLSLIHISEPTRQAEISYAVFCLKKKKTKHNTKINKKKQNKTPFR